MILSTFPPPPPGPLGSYLQQTLAILRTAFSRAVSSEEGTPRVILIAPNGTLYSVTVSNAGALVVTLNDGKTKP